MGEEPYLSKEEWRKKKKQQQKSTPKEPQPVKTSTMTE